MLGMLDNKHRITQIRLARKKRNHPEFNIHKSIANYCAQMLVPGKSFWHTTENSAGGGADARKQQAKLKFLGAKEGFPDGMVIYNDAQILFIEIKSEVGVVSDAQAAMHALLKTLGFPVAVVRSLEDFTGVIKRYGVPTREHVGVI